MSENLKKERVTFGKRSARRARIQIEEVPTIEETKTEEVIVDLENTKNEIVPETEENGEMIFDQDQIAPILLMENSAEDTEKANVVQEERVEPIVLSMNDEDDLFDDFTDEEDTFDETLDPIILLEDDEDKLFRNIQTKIEEPMNSEVDAIQEEQMEPIILFKDTENEIPEEVEEEIQETENEETWEPIILLHEDPEEVIQKELEQIELSNEDIQEDENGNSLRADAKTEKVEYVEDEDFKFTEDDLFYEKKGYLMTQYEKVEKYLEKKSAEGYHFVRKVGKKYYFIQGNKESFYYNVAYFKQEPTDEQWSEWEKLGWKFITRTPSKKKKDAGWFYFRHRDYLNEYRRTIENEEEKYNFYRKYANSCRSTLFFIFICMAVCAISAYLQWRMSAYWIGIYACGIIFFFALLLFLSYLRMLMSTRRVAKKLRIQLRLQARRQNFHGEDYDPQTDAQLDTDWNELDNEKETKKKRKRK